MVSTQQQRQEKGVVKRGYKMKNNKEKVDIKYLGIPNICFSLTEKDDSRDEEFSKQRIERGFDDSETWSLRDTIGNFILPRLIRFKEIYIETTKDDNDMYKKIDMSIRAFQLLVRDSGCFLLTEEEEKEYVDGMQAYSEIFLGLWW